MPKWDAVQAQTIFEQMYTQAGGNIQGVYAANDTLANAAIQTLKRNNQKVPVTGQDAAVVGLQNILSGDQCMTVWKPADGEAKALSDVAIALLKGDKPETTGTVEGHRGQPRRPGDPARPDLGHQGQPGRRRSARARSRSATSAPATYAAMCASAGIK